MNCIDRDNDAILAQQTEREFNARTYSRHLPPVIVSKKEIAEIATIFDEAVGAVVNGRRRTQEATG